MSSTRDRGQLNTDLLRQWAQPSFLVVLVLLPVAAGIGTGQRWGNADASFYATTAQIIATLFIAITVEFYVHLSEKWKGIQERVAIVALLVMSWIGLFACIKAMVEGGTSWSSGLAGAGLVAASGVVSLSFCERLRGGAGPRQNAIALLFLAPPVLLLTVV
jgi:hypothetical protein